LGEYGICPIRYLWSIHHGELVRATAVRIAVCQSEGLRCILSKGCAVEIAGSDKQV